MALNGMLPTEQLAVIPWDGRDRVRTYALESLVRLNGAFRAAFGHNLIVNEGYRDLDTQKRYYKNPPSGAGTAAKPGTSNHGWGLAVDLKLTPVEYVWMRANAPAFQWVNPPWAHDGKGVEEPWHWEHTGAPAVVPDRIIPQEEDDDMPLTDADVSRIAFEAVYPMLKAQEILNLNAEAVWTRQIDGVQAWAWLRDARLAADTPDGVVTAGVAALTDVDLARIATAVADETDRRSRARLG